MIGIPFAGSLTGILLIALGLGYIVCYLANREENKLRLLGFLVGIVMMTISGLLLINNIIVYSVAFTKSDINVVLPQQYRMMRRQFQGQMMPRGVQPPQPTTPIRKR